jgi:hypothetical protein
MGDTLNTRLFGKSVLGKTGIPVLKHPPHLADFDLDLTMKTI